MKITTLTILACALPMLAACVVEEPYDGAHRRGGYDGPSRVIVHTDDDDNWNRRDREHDYDHNRGRFCPPGQAKRAIASTLV